MARFCSPEWVAAFNRVVGDPTGAITPGATAPGGPDTGTGARAVEGGSRFRVAQVVTGAPGGDLRLVLEVDGRRLHLEREDLAHPGAPGPSGPRTAGDGSDEAGGAEEPDVTVVLSYEDASALSRGEVDAAQLLAGGRLKVRGNLSLLVAGQALLAAAADRLAGLSASTTY